MPRTSLPMARDGCSGAIVSLFTKSTHFNGKMKEVADKGKRVRNAFEWGKCFTACLSGSASASPRALDSPLSSTRSWTILTQDNFSQADGPPREQWQPASPRSSLSEDVFFVESSYGSSVADVASEFDDLTRTNQNIFEPPLGPDERGRAPQKTPLGQRSYFHVPGLPPRPSLIPRAPRLPRPPSTSSASVRIRDAGDPVTRGTPVPESPRSDVPSVLDSDFDSDTESVLNAPESALVDSQELSFLDIDYTRFIELTCQKPEGTGRGGLQEDRPESCSTSESGCWASPLSLETGLGQPIFFPPVEAHKPSGNEDELIMSTFWR